MIAIDEEHLNPDKLNPDTLLLRVIIKGDIEDNGITRAAFNPSEKGHKRMLSVWDSAVMSAEECFKNHMEVFHMDNAVEVLCVTVEECLNEGLIVKRDKSEDPKHNGHILVDFNLLDVKEELRRAERQAIARKLLKHAKGRRETYGYKP